ncbi:uncharacterized protein [Panulirus ornatus]|uniref:uncharacterized protein n=1 Tax=Panulirus ornatus TaxID=150431 RepID=UPI003A841A65
MALMCKLQRATVPWEDWMCYRIYAYECVLELCHIPEFHDWKLRVKACTVQQSGKSQYVLRNNKEYMAQEFALRNDRDGVTDFPSEMVANVSQLMLLLPVIVPVAVGWMPPIYAERETLTLAKGAVEAVFTRASHPRCSAILLTDGTTSTTTVYKNVESQLWAPWGIGMFEVRMNDHNADKMQVQLSKVISEARKLRQVSWCVTVLVVSDDPAFLAAFAEWSLKGRLLVWSTRLLVITHLPVPDLKALHGLLSSRNAMILTVNDASGSIKFLNAPKLLVSVIAMGIHNALLTVDPEAPEGQQLIHTGPIANVVEYLAKGQNFTYSYVVPQDNTFGTRAEDGSWNGMVGMVQRSIPHVKQLTIGP